MSKVLVVFTAKGVDQILSEGGSSSWALSSQSMRDCEYVVCTRNTDPEKFDAFGDSNPVAHGAAFLVGKFAGLEYMADRNGRRRYRVLFSSYAEVNVEDFWDGSRVPTRYLDTDEAKRRDLDLESLHFTELKRPSSKSRKSAPEEFDRNRDSLTIAEAKTRLATTFGVSEDQIEIVIRT